MDARQKAMSSMSKEELVDAFAKGEITQSEYLKYAEGMTSQGIRNARKAQHFGMVLYPDDPQHMKFLAYIKAEEGALYKGIAYILHDKDVWMVDDEEVKNGTHAEGELKKSHYHVLIKTQTRTTASTISKFYLGLHCEAINSVESYLKYMVHGTPDSWGKYQYPFEELKGTQKLLDLITVQKSHFV